MIIIGLGNYGDKYENTSHNVVFMVLDKLKDKLNIVFKKKICKSLVAESFIKGEKHVFAKPQTYMNLSGLAVKELMGNYKQEIEDVVVIVDDIDLPLGVVRIRKSGGAGTHNGLRNIIAETGAKEFIRIRVGVGGKPHEKMDLADWVLSKFNKDEMKSMDIAFDNASDACVEMVEGKSIDLVMGKFNAKNWYKK